MIDGRDVSTASGLPPIGRCPVGGSPTLDPKGRVDAVLSRERSHATYSPKETLPEGMRTAVECIKLPIDEVGFSASSSTTNDAHTELTGIA